MNLTRDQLIGLLEGKLPDAEGAHVVAKLRALPESASFDLNAQGSINVTGDGNVIGDHNNIFVLKSEMLADLVRIVREAIEQRESPASSDRRNTDACFDSLQSYLRDLRLLCAQPPYLTLKIRQQDARKSPDHYYVPLRARRFDDVKEEVMLEEVLLPDGEETSLEGSAPLLRSDGRSSDSKPLQHILLMCSSGRGKSTALLRFAAAAWDDWATIGLDRRHIPMLVKLQALMAAEGETISKHLLAALSKAGELSLNKQPPADFFEQWSQLCDAPWLLLFDGLDEVPIEEREKLFRWFSRFVERYAERGHRIILTSRPFEEPEIVLGANFAVYELQPFLPHQKQDFARRYLKDRAEAFLAELSAKGWNESSDTPLVLTIAIDIFSKDGSLPGQRTALFQRSIAIWLEEATARGLQQELGDPLFDVAQRGLEQLALAAVEHPERTDQAELPQAISDYLQAELNVPEAQAAAQGERFVRVMGRRSGVFIQRGESCEWAHQAFRDFLAASALERQLKKTNYDYAQVIGEHISDEVWLEPLLALAQITARATDLVKWASEEARRLEDDRLALVAWDFWQEGTSRPDEEARQIVVDLLLDSLHFSHSFRQDTIKKLLVERGDVIIEGVLAKLSDTSSLTEKVQFIELLGRVGGERAIKRLIALLGHEEPPVSDAAYTAFRRIGQPAIEPLLAIVRNNLLSAEERSHGLYALGEVGIRADEICETVADCLTEGLAEEASLLGAAITVARRLRDTRQGSAVVQALAFQDEMIAYRAADYLCEFPSDAAFPVLLQTFHHWSSPDQQRSSLLRHLLFAMGRVETPEASVAILQLLRDSLDSKTGLSSLWAAWTADELELPATRALLVEELARLLLEQPTNHLIWQILRRLEEYWKPTHLAALREASNRLSGSGINVTRLLADEVIAGAQSVDEHPLSDHSGQHAGIKMLAKIQSPDFVQEANRLLTHVDWSVENKLLEYLWVAGDPAAESALLLRLTQPQRSHNPDWTYRNDIIRALGTCGADGAVPSVIAYLRTEQNIGLYVAREALCPLLRRGVLSAESVAEIACDSSATVPGRTASIEALGLVCPANYTGVFRHLLVQTEDEWILSYTAHALGETRDATVVADLEALLETTNSPRVAVEAANSLVRLDARQSAPTVRRAMHRLGVASGNYGLLVAMGWFQDESIIPQLKVALNEAKRTLNPNWVLASIGRFLPADWAREWLLDALESWNGSHFDDGLQKAAVETLARNAPELLIIRVTRLYDTEHLYQSSREMLTAWIPELSRKGDLDAGALSEVVKRLLRDREISVREKMGLELSKLDPAICQQVYEELRSSSDEWWQACAISSLGYWQADDAELRSARFAKTARLRYAVDLADEQRQRMNALRGIAEQYCSKDGKARLAAYLVIKEQGDESVIKDLYGRLSESDLSYIYLRKLGHDVRDRLKKDRQKRAQEGQKRFD